MQSILSVMSAAVPGATSPFGCRPSCLTDQARRHGRPAARHFTALRTRVFSSSRLRAFSVGRLASEQVVSIVVLDGKKKGARALGTWA